MDIKDLPYILTAAYLIIINIIGFILPPVDKSKAKKNKWRIRERTLFIVSALGGSVAMYISMRIFHHKTKHKRYMIGIPEIIVLPGFCAYAENAHADKKKRNRFDITVFNLK